VNKFASLIVVIGAFLFPNYALCGSGTKSDAVAVVSPSPSSTSRASGVASSGKTAKQLMQEAEALKAEAELKLAAAEAKWAEVTELKTKTIAGLNAALQDPNSTAQRSAEVWSVMGEVETDEKPVVRFINERFNPLDALTMEAFEPKVIARLKALETQLQSVCKLKDWKLVTVAFTITEGKLLRGAPELREMVPATPEDRAVANCMMLGLANTTWENFGEEVNAFVIWRSLGEP